MLRQISPAGSDSLASNWILRERKCFVLRILYEGMGMCGELPVRYSLVVEDLKDVGENYGIWVESGGEQLLQRRIQALLELLMEGNVTAVTARDVVEDWLLY